MYIKVMFWSMLFFAVMMGLIIAKLEVNIEGKHGWARDLPTYRFSNWLSRIIIGKTQVTGYHVWLVVTIVMFLQFPFFMGFPWSLALELQILGLLFIGVIVEDFFWFIWNPAFGVKKFSKQHAPWHRWIGPIPAMYLIYSLAAILLLTFSSIL